MNNLVTTGSENNNDKRGLIFAECEIMEKEGFSDISSRTVSARQNVKWGKSTVSKFVTEWHNNRDAKKLEIMEQTRLSPIFVEALNREIENRQLEQNNAYKETIERQQSQLMLSNEDLESNENELREAKANAGELAVNRAELKTELKNEQQKYADMYKSLNEKFNEETQKLNARIIELTEKNEELHNGINEKTESLGAANQIAKTAADEVLSLNKTVADLAIESKNKQEEISVFKTEVATLKEQSTSLKHDIKSKDDLVKLHKEQQSKYETEVKEKATEIKELRVKLEDTTKELMNKVEVTTKEFHQSTLKCQSLEMELKAKEHISDKPVKTTEK